ncbi:restriction endonuclease subunit S [Helicobacter pylori]|uniref:restriction endonuclease subunit S n=1 Tax=Helicobacter pylori TaxID=210 RepID=UPI0009528F9C|nr:restriction endonuclease subunit S [Helicobacter pylori]OLR43993.1 restriction endonuclease subunit S [Helicobacter pylori]OLR48115.1 restriction endonuclease subunit S [Helicobacter pylori]
MDALMLPLNWQRVRLGDIANYLTSNLSAEQITQQGKIKVYDVNNFIGYTDTTFISDKPYISIVKDGSVGRVRILPPKTNILSTMGALIANHRTTTEFLFYLLSNFDFKNFTSGSIIPHIYFKDYKEKTIFLPPLNEQSAIANILSGLDRYLYALDALILKKEGVKKALSFELLSQRKRLKGFNQAWQRVRLGDIANYLTSNLSAEQITQQGKIKVYDVNNFIGYTDTTFISDKPYISIVKDGSVGRVRILPPKTNILSTMGALIANHRTTTEFLFYLLSNFDFKNFTSGSIIPHIYFKDYKEKTIFLPPLNEQSAIANILSDLDNEIASLKNKKRQFENIKKALNHDLMSAKIRVLEK